MLDMATNNTILMFILCLLCYFASYYIKCFIFNWSNEQLRWMNRLLIDEIVDTWSLQINYRKMMKNEKTKQMIKSQTCLMLVKLWKKLKLPQPNSELID